MSDPLRSDRPALPADSQERERDARVEHLLLSGLDHYFAGQYDLAISVWTRVLFLNHRHARARAYIDRARSAIAERQRESEELLHSGVEAFGRGETTVARSLLTSAVEKGAGTEEALALLDRLDRLAPAGAQTTRLGAFTRASARPVDPAGVPPAVTPRLSRWMTLSIAAAVLVAAAAGWFWIRGSDAWPVAARKAAQPAAGFDLDPLPVPDPSDVSLSRARTLQAKGRLHEALTALDGVRRGDSAWTEAQTLRVLIQRQLLAGTGVPLARPGAAVSRQVSRQ
jgi:tetratricopeptide (TPR) repeat protein